MAAGAFGRAVNALGPLFVLPCFLQSWGPDLYGEWLLLTSIPACILLAPDFGLVGVATNRMAYLVGEGRNDEAQDLFNTAFWVLCFSSSLLAAIGIAVCALTPWSSLLSVGKIKSSEIPVIIALLLLQIVFQQLAGCLTGAYRCSLQNAKAGVLFGVFAFAETGTLIIALTIGQSPMQIAGLMLVNRFACFCVVLLDARQLPGAPRVRLSAPHIELVRPLLLPAMGQGGMPLLHMMQNQWLLALVGATAGMSEIAVFQSLRTLSNGVKSLFGIIGAAIIAELPHALGVGDVLEVGRLFRRVRVVGMAMAGIALCGVVFAGRPIYELWTRGTTEFDISVAILLAISLFPFFWCAPASIHLHAANKLHTAVPWNILWMFLSLGVTWLLGSWIGLVAAALSMVAWEIANAITLTFCSTRLSPEIWRNGTPTAREMVESRTHGSRLA